VRAQSAVSAITAQVVRSLRKWSQVMHDEDNDSRFPDESPVEVRYPRSKQEEQGYGLVRVGLASWSCD